MPANSIRKKGPDRAAMENLLALSELSSRSAKNWFLLAKSGNFRWLRVFHIFNKSKYNFLISLAEMMTRLITIMSLLPLLVLFHTLYLALNVVLPID